MVSDKIKMILKQKGVKVSQLAEYMNVKPQSVTNKFSRDSWSVQDLISVLDFLDCIHNLFSLFICPLGLP